MDGLQPRREILPTQARPHARDEGPAKAAKNDRGKLSECAPRPRIFLRACGMKTATSCRISCTRPDDVFVSGESGRPCESAFAELTEHCGRESICVSSILNAVIFRKAFRRQTTFRPPGRGASGAGTRITGGPVTAPRPACCRGRMTRRPRERPEDARAGCPGRPHPDPPPPQISLQLAGFRDISGNNIRVLSCRAPSQTAIPRPSI